MNISLLPYMRHHQCETLLHIRLNVGHYTEGTEHVGGVTDHVIVGGVTDHVIVGGVTDHVIVGGVTDHVIVGGVTDHVIVGGVIDHVIVGGVTDHVIVGRVTDHVIVGRVTDHVIVGRVTDHVIVGRVTDHVIVGGITDHVIVGGVAASTLHLKLMTPPSWATALCGFLTNLGQASRRSGNNMTFGTFYLHHSRMMKLLKNCLAYIYIYMCPKL